MPRSSTTPLTPVIPADTVITRENEIIARINDLDAQGTVGGLLGITVQDEGGTLATAASALNFVGAGVTASGTGATKTLNIPGGSGSGRPVYNLVTDYGADNTGVTACDTAFANALAAQAGSGNRPIYLPPGIYRVSATITIPRANCEIFGAGMRVDVASVTGTEIAYYGTGALFKTTGDESSALDAAVYTGTSQPFILRDVCLRHKSPDTLLGGGVTSYKAGSYGLRDWRSGSIFMERVHFRNFDYGFWGVGSDFTASTDCVFWYCNVGMYLGPRSDQNHHRHVNTLACNTAIWCERMGGATFDSFSSTDDGSLTTPVIRIDSSYSSHGTFGITFIGPWLERYGSSGAGIVLIPAVIDIGVVGNAMPTRSVEIINPVFWNNDNSKTPYAIRLGGSLTGGATTGVRVLNPTGDLSTFTTLIKNHAGNGRALVEHALDQSVGASGVQQQGTGGTGTWTVVDRTY